MDTICTIRNEGRSNFIFLWILLCFVTLLSQVSFADSLANGSYDVYRGDLDGDGIGDVYLHNSEYVVISTSSPLTIIPIDGDRSYLLTGIGGGSYSNPTLTSVASLTGLTLQSSNVSHGDFNSDGYVDLLVQGESAQDNSLVVQGTAAGSTVSLADQFNFFSGISTDPTSVSVGLNDTNGDGYADLQFVWVNGGESTYLNVGNGQFDFVEPGVLLVETGIQATSLAGGMPYGLSVDDRGQNRIAIPIQVPIGVNGHQPSLTLGYSSGGSRKLMDDTEVSGSLGYGWDVSGIPEVRRCRFGAGGGLELNATDRLCYGGSHLVLDTGASYWADDATYRVSLKPEIRVVANGTFSSQERTFDVYLPDGRVQSFGTEVSQRVSPSDSTVVYRWTIDRDVDDYGNMISYHWLQRPADGIAVPHFIEYDGAEVQFRYLEREDTTEVNLGEENVPGVTRQPFVLDHIFTTIDSGSGAIDRDLYTFDTALDATSTYRRLMHFQQCAYNAAGSTSKCLEPLELTWVTGTNPEEEFNNSVSRIENGLGLWDEIDYELIPSLEWALIRLS